MTRDVDDPWYTGCFEDTYRDVLMGCKGFIKQLREQEKNIKREDL